MALNIPRKIPDSSGSNDLPPPPFMQVACTLVKTDTVPSKSFEVNIGSTLLLSWTSMFSTVRKKRSTLRVRMVPPIEELCGCVTEWRDILLGKGLDVNAAKSILMVGRRGVVGYSENVSVM